MITLRRLLLQISSLAILCLSVSAVFAQDTDHTELIKTLMEQVEAQELQVTESLDGSISASVTVYSCTDIEGQEYAYEQLNLTPQSGDAVVVAEQFIACGGLGGYGLWILRWTDTYLYYTDARVGVPDGLQQGYAPPIWRFDLETMEAHNLGQALFSPDGQSLVAWSGTMIRVIESNGMETVEFTATSEDFSIATVLWLPDSSGILYIQADAPFASTQSSVTHIDIATGEQSVLLMTGG